MLLFRKSDFLFFETWILTCRFFFRKKTFLFVLATSCVCQVAGISKRSDNFYFPYPMLLIELFSISNMGVSLVEICFCSRLYGYLSLIRTARNLLATRVIIKIESCPFYSINVEWFSWGWSIFFESAILIFFLLVERYTAWSLQSIHIHQDLWGISTFLTLCSSLFHKLKLGCISSLLAFQNIFGHRF